MGVASRLVKSELFLSTSSSCPSDCLLIQAASQEESSENSSFPGLQSRSILRKRMIRGKESESQEKTEAGSLASCRAHLTHGLCTILHSVRLPTCRTPHLSRQNQGGQERERKRGKEGGRGLGALSLSFWERRTMEWNHWHQKNSH